MAMMHMLEQSRDAMFEYACTSLCCVYVFWLDCAYVFFTPARRRPDPAISVTMRCMQFDE
jgi:hypothetical protein